MKNTHSAESNEKSILRFLFFELCLIVFTIHHKFTDQKKKLFRSVKIYEKYADCSKNDILIHEFFCATYIVFDIWSILCMVDMAIAPWLSLTHCMHAKLTISQKL